MVIKKIHYISGLTITIFAGLHLFNHSWSILGADRHIELMNTLRLFYRNIFVETILLSAVMIQIVSGLKLFMTARKNATSFFDKLHLWTGLYLAIFFVIHLSAIFFWAAFSASCHKLLQLIFYSLLWTCYQFIFWTHCFNSQQKNETLYFWFDAKQTVNCNFNLWTFSNYFNFLRADKPF
jgi:hypothetical protein